MQPTKLPDELFPDDEWQRADYPRRVALLVDRCHGMRLARDGARAQCETLKDELRAVREVNAQLALDLEQTGAMNAQLLRQLADAVSVTETKK
jgi:hypothetical protein